MDSTESPNKTLTHKFSTKYDLHFLKQVQGIENQLIESLAKVYNLEDPDDIPLDIDIQGICLNPEIADKVAAFKASMKSCPHDISIIIENISNQILALQNLEKK